MKVKISYTSPEDEEAAAVVAAIRERLPSVRVHRSDAKCGVYHVYLTTKKPKRKENA